MLNGFQPFPALHLFRLFVTKRRFDLIKMRVVFESAFAAPGPLKNTTYRVLRWI